MAACAVDDGAKKSFYSLVLLNDAYRLNGTTKGGLVGSVIQVTAIDTNSYLVHNTLLLGSGTIG